MNGINTRVSPGSLDNSRPFAVATTGSSGDGCATRITAPRNPVFARFRTVMSSLLALTRRAEV
jgi:hypothetical protein